MAQQLRENSIALISRTIDVDMQSVGTLNLFTVPVDFTLIITNVIVHSISGSLAGGIDYDIGDTVGGIYYLSTVDLSSLTATNDMISLYQTVKGKIFIEGSIIKIETITGSSSAETSTIDIYGYLM